MSNSNDQNQSEGFFYNLSETKQHLIALAILFLVPFILFTATTIGGKEFQRHDITQWRAGSESAFEYRETYGEDPLWINNMYMGMPAFVVSVKTVVPHLNFLSGFFNKIYPAFQYWVLLSGMYLLLILMGFRPLTAAFGSITYGLTSYFPIIIGAGHTSKFFALAFAPWIFAGYWKLTRSKNKLSGLLFFTVAIALQVKAGHPQITYYFMYLLGFLWIADSSKWIKENEYKKFGIITGLLLIGGVVGILNHAQSLLTLKEYAEFSIRGGSALDGTSGLSTGYAFAWSQGIKETLTLFVPEIFGGASPNYFGPKSVTSGPHYLGALVLPFLLIALFKQKSRTMLVFFITGSIAVLFAWGENFKLINELAFDYIPFFNKFRAPETWLVITAFCYSIVAVYGFDWLLNYIKLKTANIKNLALPLGLTTLIFVFILIQVKTMDYSRPGEIDNIAQQIAQQNQVSPQNPQVQQQASNYVQQNFIPVRKEGANKDLFRFGLFLVGSVVLIWLLIKQKISVSLASIGFLLISFIDMTTVGKRYVPDRVIVNGNINPERYLDSQKRDIDQYIIDNNKAENDSYEFRTFPLLDGAFQTAVPSYFYPTIGGYTGAKLSIVADLQKNNGPLYKGDAGLNLDLLGVLNIKYITYQSGLQIPNLKPVFNGRNGTVYENTKLQPKAFFVDSLVYASSAQEAYDFVDQPNINYSEIAVVETNKNITIKSDTSASVTITNYTGQEISLRTNRSTPGFLVLSEIYYPAGWSATLDGKEIPIHKTNYVLRGLEVPQGNHQIELRFEPKSFYLGVTIGWISLALQILLALVVGFKYIRKKRVSN